MPRPPRRATIPLLAMTALLLVGCPRSGPDSRTTGTLTSEDSAVAIDVVHRFGARLQRVPLLAPDSIVRASMEREYGDLVSRPLLDEWLRNPSHAPGRQTSSPWPDRIEVREAVQEPLAGGPPQLVVVGSIVERTSATPEGDASGRVPVRIEVERQDGEWRIAAYRWGEEHNTGGEPAESSDGKAPEPDVSTEAAARVVRSYYRALAERRYRDAYRAWASEGAASGQSYDEFARGFASIDSVEADVGPPGRVEGAAGSRYIKVPVRVYILRSGTRESYAGTYTLRRSVVDGASPSQHSWRIDSADLKRRPARTATR